MDWLAFLFFFFTFVLRFDIFIFHLSSVFYPLTDLVQLWTAWLFCAHWIMWACELKSPRNGEINLSASLLCFLFIIYWIVCNELLCLLCGRLTDILQIIFFKLLFFFVLFSSLHYWISFQISRSMFGQYWWGWFAYNKIGWRFTKESKYFMLRIYTYVVVTKTTWLFPWT